MIDSVSEGLALVRRRPGLIALPVAIDLLLWAAPQLSLEPLARRAAEGVVAPAGLTGSEAYEAVRAVREFLLDFGQHSNLLALLGNGFVGVPSILSAGLPEGLQHLGGRLLVQSFPTTLALAVVLTLAGLVVAAAYLTAIAAAVREEPIAFSSFLRKAAHNSLRLCSFVAALIGGGLALGLPATLLGLLVAVAGAGVASFALSLVALFALWAGLWVLIYLFFVVDSLILQEVGLGRAIVNSILVVRTSFWPALGLILLLNVLGAGLGVVWRWLASALPGGVVLAIPLNAFVGTGLATASFLFYRDRYQKMRERFAGKGG